MSCDRVSVTLNKQQETGPSLLELNLDNSDTASKPNSARPTYVFNSEPCNNDHPHNQSNVLLDIDRHEKPHNHVCLSHDNSLCQTQLAKGANVADVYHQAFIVNPSPIKPFALISWLAGYDVDLKTHLINSVIHGIRIPTEMTQHMQTSIPDNQPSAMQNYDAVNAMLKEELDLSRIAGPFHKKTQASSSHH